MAAGTKKSVNITNIETLPVSMLNKKVGVQKVMIDEVELATTNIDDIGDKILFGPIPSNAIIQSIGIVCDDLDSHATPTLAVDVGLYYSGPTNGTGKTSGLVLDADCFATAVTTLQAAVVTPTEVRFEAANIDTIDLEAWEVGGLTSDCGGDLFIGLTVTAAAATAAAGGVKLIVRYI